MDLDDERAARVGADEAGEGLVAADERELVGVDGEGVGDEVVEVGGDDDAVAGVGEDLREDGVAEAGVLAGEDALEVGVALVGAAGEAAREDLRVRLDGAGVVEARDAESGGGGPGGQGAALVVLAGITVTIAAMRIATEFVRGYAVAESGPLPSTSIFVNLTRIAIVLLGALLVLNALNISITPVLTALGVGGLAVALALQDTLGNLFAGLQLVASKQVRPGDYLLLESGQEGTVEDIAWRYTTMRTQANNLVVVPNAKLGQTIITNFQLPSQPLSIIVEFGVAYGSDLERSQAIAQDVAARVMAEMQPDITEWEPVVRFSGFGDSDVQAIAIMRVVDFGDQYALKSEFIKRLHARFAEEGIEFPFPQRVVHQA